jgi:hypothetical protein
MFESYSRFFSTTTMGLLMIGSAVAYGQIGTFASERQAEMVYSYSTDKSLVPDENGVMMYDYGGGIGIVYNPKVVAIEGLRYYHNFYYMGDTQAKKYFLNTANWLVKNAYVKDGGNFSLWEYDFEWMHYGGVVPPYASGLAQAEGAELLAKAYQVTGDQKYLQAAKQAIAALLVDIDDGGVSSIDQTNGDVNGSNSSLFIQILAKPGIQETYVLNGHTGALLHTWRYYNVTGDPNAIPILREGINYLKEHLKDFDKGDWSYYDKLGTVASDSYHEGHIKQLNYLYEITGEPILKEYSTKFAEYSDDRSQKYGTTISIVP